MSQLCQDCLLPQYNLPNLIDTYILTNKEISFLTEAVPVENYNLSVRTEVSLTPECILNCNIIHRICVCNQVDVI